MMKFVLSAWKILYHTKENDKSILRSNNKQAFNPLDIIPNIWDFIKIDCVISNLVFIIHHFGNKAMEI